MKWPIRILIALALLLASAVALPFLIPLDDYIPRIEKAASDRLKQPVAIKRIGLRALPMPQLAIDGISVGTGDDLMIGKVVLIPDLLSLLQPTKVIKRVEIDSLALTRTAIDRIPGWAKSDGAGSAQHAPQVRVESIRFNNARVNFGKASFGPFDASVSLDGRGATQNASITTRDGKLKVLITPDQSRYLIDASAKSWTLPVGPALVFDELVIKGVATSEDAKLGEMRARLYGGTATGKAAFNWRKALKLEGKLDVRGMELKQVANLLSPGTRLSGKLSAEPVFSASAQSADQLMQALRLQTRFDVQNGVLYGVDIEKSATQLIKQGTAGEETRFEQLSGHLDMEHGGYRFTQLKIASGALAAEGNVSVSAKKELSGRINAHVKAVGSGAGVPLNIAGTVEAPRLFPTGGTLAGAAVGTAVLGPVVGTSVGAKVGGWVEGLFGKKDAETPRK